VRLGGRARIARSLAVVSASAVALAACSGGNVPYFTAPTSVANSPSGIQNAITGLFAESRTDIGAFTTTISASYARDGGTFSNSSGGQEYALGAIPTPTNKGSIWASEYQNILQAHQTLAAIPKVSPAYTAAQIAALNGVVQTIEAYNYMLVAEAHDTLGMAIQPANSSPGTALPQAACMKGGWAYIVALLDTANNNLTVAGSIPIPVTLPSPGFAGVSATAGPSTAVGSFASFNRALAAKANLELAYAIARSNGGVAPTPTSPGSPDAGVLNTALADLTASAMFNPSQLAPTTAGGFAPNAYTVTFDFSANSGDFINPIKSELGELAQLNDFIADVDTAHDLRWKAKFILNPNAVQQPLYNTVASKYLYDMYPSTNSPMPILREETLVLIDAEIQLGLGNLSAALTAVNAVRTTVGGLPAFPPSVAGSYTSMRDSLMKEQRISLTFEPSADRTIAIRMYGLASVADTTWNHEDPAVTTPDQHTTVNPIPVTELEGRGGSFTTSCP